MPYCTECGVELDPSAEECPLCGTEVCRPTPPPGLEQGYAESGEIEDMLANRPPGYERRLAVQILSVLFVTPLLITVVVDWLISGQLTWSLYVGVSVTAAWVYSVVPILMRRHLTATLAICVAMTGVLMWSVDVLDERTEWFLGVGLPILAVLLLITAAVALVSKFSRRHGANIPGFILLGIILMCAAVDVISKLYVESQQPLLTWSLIVAAALGPVAAFLLYYHYALSSRINLRKHWHL